MNNRFKKKLFEVLVYLMLFLAITVLVSCKGKEENGESNVTVGNEPTLKSLDEPLKILYDPYAYSAILNFQAENPEIEIDIVRLDQDLESGIRTLEPDLVIITPNYAYKDQWEKGKNAADLREFCANDMSLDINNYFPGTFEIFTNEENGLHALPLGITFNMLTIREEKWIGSAFEALGESYTGKELLMAIEEEMDKEREIDEFFACTSGGDPMGWLYMLNAVERKEEDIIIDEELFELVYNVSNKWYEQYQSVKDQWGGQGIGNDNHYYSALDPRIYAGKYEVSLSGGSLNAAPQLCLAYAVNSNLWHMNQPTEVVYFPEAENENSYGAEVTLLGFVSDTSYNKEEAYQLLRLFMDAPISDFRPPNGTLSDTYCPVNKENALGVMGTFEKIEEEYLGVSDPIGVNLFIMEKNELDSELKEKLNDVLGNISYLYVLMNDEHVKVDEIYGRYLHDGVSNYKGCYIEIMQLLNPNDHKWVLTEEEFKAYMTETEEAGSTEHEGEGEERPHLAEEEQIKAQLRTAEVGDKVLLGEYEQDNDTTNGAEEISWIVLEKQDDKMLLLSEYCLDRMKYCPGFVEEEEAKGYKSVWSQNVWYADIEVKKEVFSVEAFRWDDRNVRKWIQNEFIDNAFDDAETNLILQTSNIHTKSSDMEEVTEDYVFILDSAEVEKYLPKQDMRICQATDYAKRDVAIKGNDSVYWVLREVGNLNDQYVAQIRENGEIDLQGGMTINHHYVRPAMWVDIAE